MPQPLREEDLNIITKKVYALYAKYGADGISMDEVSRQASISKATLYRYYTSKEDIVRSMVDLLISHLDSVHFDAVRNIDDVREGLQKIYVKSLFVAALTGTLFLQDLRNKHAGLYASYQASLKAIRERAAGFFEQATKAGFLRELPFSLICVQFRGMLPTIINMDFLEENRLSLRQAIREYYRMFLLQVLREEYRSVTEEEETYRFAADLAVELQNDFFIDSIRR